LWNEILERKRPLLSVTAAYAHRARQNTLPSFQLRSDAGADLIELDISTAKDGVPMVIHDQHFGRTTDARKKWKRGGSKSRRKRPLKFKRRRGELVRCEMPERRCHC